MPERELFIPPSDEYPELFASIPLHLDEQKRYPNGSVDDWRGTNDPHHRIDIQDNLEPLVNVASLDPPIFSTNDYAAKLSNSAYEQALSGTVLSQYLRQTPADRLVEVQRKLPRGYRLIIYDGWRSLETQYDAYMLCFDSIVDELITKNILTSRDISPEVRALISEETQKYIALPSPMPESTNPSPESVKEAKKIPAPHSTGGAVDAAIVCIDDEVLEDLEQLEEALSGEIDPVKRADLDFQLAAIYRLHATLLDFGTDFDFAGKESGLTHFEHDDAPEHPKLWRRLLYNLMTEAGFESYSEEWWHFNFGNQPAERTKWLRSGEKGVAVYGNTDLTNEQKEFERLHTILFNELIRIHNIPRSEYKVYTALARLGVTTAELFDLSEKIGDPRETRSLGNPHDMKYRGTLPDEFIQSIKDQLERES